MVAAWEEKGFPTLPYRKLFFAVEGQVLDRDGRKEAKSLVAQSQASQALGAPAKVQQCDRVEHVLD